MYRLWLCVAVLVDPDCSIAVLQCVKVIQQACAVGLFGAVL